ncbi:MAG TPA: CaiB/BaiF CoA-transferase family protein [Ohtaekwangia sp.]
MEIFKDLKVLELASVLAGPSVGQFFAELGADVIKVENPRGGDVTRSWKGVGELTDDRSAYFCSVNWGKKSVALDLSTPDGKAYIQKIIPETDVVIASYKPGDAEKLGVDYASLTRLNAKLIYGTISGYGTDNPRVGYDAVIQAEAGFMYMNGEAKGPSLKMPVALIDVLAGHQLKEGLLLALLNRERTGKGDFVQVSLLQTAVSSLVNQATNYLVAGSIPQKHGSEHPNIAPYGDTFQTLDGQEIILAVGNDKQFQELCALLGIQQVSAAEHFKTNAQRVINRSELNILLQEAFIKFQSEDLLPKIHFAKIPAGIIQNLEQVFQLDEAKQLVLEGEGLKGVRTYAAKHSSVSVAKTLTLPPVLGSTRVK